MLYFFMCPISFYNEPEEKHLYDFYFFLDNFDMFC